MKFKKIILASAAIVSLVSVGLLSSCGQQGQTESQATSVLKIGILLGSGGLGDKSFNDSAYKGLLDAQKKYNLRFETANFSTPEANLDSLRAFARQNCDLIIGIAYENLNNVQTVAAEFPKIHFAEIDAELNAPNVESFVFREQEGDFLMGVLAAMLTQTKYVGVIGGTDIPAIQRIMAGYRQGVAYQDAGVKTFADFAGTFSDPQVGLDLASKRYAEGADIIHNAASKTGLGIIQAAQRLNRWTTGTSGDQRSLAPGNVIGNRPKRVDTAVLMAIQAASTGKFTPGVLSLGLKEDGLTLGPFDETIVKPDMLNRLETLKQKIIAGEIHVQAQ